MLGSITKCLIPGYDCACMGRAEWGVKADAVAATLKSTLWRPEMKACFDKDIDGNWVTTLVHNNLRMYVTSRRNGSDNRLN